ncbi:hypothetical protein HDA32_002684 [Spinactinospora alkalitolerans]|uniref:Uncharacterized protein n=1 Tax=Spinactinospora alkalitolerans TaxID=687207 RepID=A0A852U027_9ACTN|nr:hypothetical protein [Spinactinospora alkalitolerans]NYE47564.1 hypothetical protein [Spinactinospora alkalitolerans]
MRQILRRAAAIAAVAVMTAGAFTAVAAPAQAASFSFGDYGLQSDGSRYITIGNSGSDAGVVLWNADPGSNNGWPKGDTLYARDSLSDGYAVEGRVYYDGGGFLLYAATSGHTAPYTASKTKNIAEGTRLLLRVCVLQGSSKIACSPYYSAHA